LIYPQLLAPEIPHKFAVGICQQAFGLKNMYAMLTQNGTASTHSGHAPTLAAKSAGGCMSYLLHSPSRL